MNNASCVLLLVLCFAYAFDSACNAQTAEENALKILQNRLEGVNKDIGKLSPKVPLSTNGGARKFTIYENEINDAFGDYYKSIYFFDDRFDFDAGTAEERRAVRTTLAVVHEKSMIKNADGTFSLFEQPVGFCGPNDIQKVNKSLGTVYSAERFSDQPRVSFCTAFKVGPSQIVTAGHCVPSAEACNKLRFISDYLVEGENAKPHKAVNPSRVYSCKKLKVAVMDSESGVEFAVIEVDRNLDGVEKVTLPLEATTKLDDRVTVVGYPSGLPAKITRNGVVRSVNPTYFVTDLDTFGGNSGSPVFDQNTLASGQMLAIGILVRGENDFEVQAPCLVSKRCSKSGCRGEDIVFTSNFYKFVE